MSDIIDKSDESRYFLVNELPDLQKLGRQIYSCLSESEAFMISGGAESNRLVKDKTVLIPKPVVDMHIDLGGHGVVAEEYRMTQTGLCTKRGVGKRLGGLGVDIILGFYTHEYQRNFANILYRLVCFCEDNFFPIACSFDRYYIFMISLREGNYGAVFGLETYGADPFSEENFVKPEYLYLNIDDFLVDLGPSYDDSDFCKIAEIHSLVSNEEITPEEALEEYKIIRENMRIERLVRTKAAVLKNYEEKFGKSLYWNKMFAPEFEPYAIISPDGVAIKVEIMLSGNRSLDFRNAAVEAAKRGLIESSMIDDYAIPSAMGFAWFIKEDVSTAILIPDDLHRAWYQASGVTIIKTLLQQRPKLAKVSPAIETEHPLSFDFYKGLDSIEEVQRSIFNSVSDESKEVLEDLIRLDMIILPEPILKMLDRLGATGWISFKITEQQIFSRSKNGVIGAGKLLVGTILHVGPTNLEEQYQLTPYLEKIAKIFGSEFFPFATGLDSSQCYCISLKPEAYGQVYVIDTLRFDLDKQKTCPIPQPIYPNIDAFLDDLDPYNPDFGLGLGLGYAGDCGAHTQGTEYDRFTPIRVSRELEEMRLRACLLGEYATVEFNELVLSTPLRWKDDGYPNFESFAPNSKNGVELVKVPINLSGNRSDDYRNAAIEAARRGLIEPEMVDDFALPGSMGLTWLISGDAQYALLMFEDIERVVNYTSGISNLKKLYKSENR